MSTNQANDATGRQPEDEPEAGGTGKPETAETSADEPAEETGEAPQSASAQPDSAQPDSAQPDSAQPDSAQPDSAGSATSESATTSDEDTSADEADREDTRPSRPAAKVAATTTPGQRLAARKAAKAARKAASRGKDAEVREAEALKRAAAAADFMQRQRKLVWGGIAVLVLLVAGISWYTTQRDAAASAAAGALMAATDTATAALGSGAGTDETETYATLSARGQEASKRFEKVIEQHGNTDAATWALLGQGSALLEASNPAEARKAFEQALKRAGDNKVIAWRALEGAGFSFEAEEKWDEAAGRFKELSELAGGAFKNVGDYHLARVYLAKGDEVKAKELLKGVLDRLGEEGAPELPYLQGRTQSRLRTIDPESVPAAPTNPFGGMGGGMPGLGGAGGQGPSPEQLQEMLRRLQQQQGGGLPGGGLPGGAPPTSGAGAPEPQ